MYDTLLENSVKIAERYADALEYFIRTADTLECFKHDEIESGAERKHYDRDSRRNRDIKRDGSDAGKAGQPDKRKKRYSEEQLRKDALKAFFSVFTNAESRCGDYKWGIKPQAWAGFPPGCQNEGGF